MLIYIFSPSNLDPVSQIVFPQKIKIKTWLSKYPTNFLAFDLQQ